MIRKEGKLPGKTLSEAYGLEYDDDVIEIQKNMIDPDEKFALIDDVLATGGTMKAGAKLVERSGGEVASCTALIEIEGLEGRELLESYGYDVNTVLTR